MTRKRILKPHSERNFNRVVIGWVFTVCLIGEFSVISQLRLDSCNWCSPILTCLPWLHNLAENSKFVSQLEVVWLFCVLGSPVLLVLLFVFVDDFEQRVLQGWAVMLFVFGIVFFFILFAVASGEPSSNATAFGRLYRNSFLFFSDSGLFYFRIYSFLCVFFNSAYTRSGR